MTLHSNLQNLQDTVELVQREKNRPYNQEEWREIFTSPSSLSIIAILIGLAAASSGATCGAVGALLAGLEVKQTAKYTALGSASLTPLLILSSLTYLWYLGARSVDDLARMASNHSENKISKHLGRTGTFIGSVVFFGAAAAFGTYLLGASAGATITETVGAAILGSSIVTGFSMSHTN